MRKLAVLLLLTLSAPLAFPAKRVTVEKLEQFLAASKSLSDEKLADRLSNLELNERLSTASLMRWKSQMPGNESRRALTALADESTFLKPPAAEIANKAPLDPEGQRQLLLLASEYAQKAISRLPNFFASRQSTLFEDTPARQSGGNFYPNEPLHYVDTSIATVLYRSGSEKLDSATGTPTHDNRDGELTSSGQFGPVLAKVLTDTAQGTVEWSYWEQADSGPRAVFRYKVPRDKSHYNVQLSLAWYKGDVVKEQPGYHGEITIDPADGTVLRLTMLADLKPSNPMVRSDLMVEYGPVEIGGKTYICPLRSVTLVLAHSQTTPFRGGQSELEGSRATPTYGEASRAEGPPQTLLNDVAFDHYHIFRSDTEMLTGVKPVPNANAN